MANLTFKEQLKVLKDGGKLKLRYPDGYKSWKKKFDYWYRTTNKDLNQTLDIMYGPGGGVNNYKGSLYKNSNFRVPKEKHNRNKKFKKQNEKSGIFKGIK